MALEDPMREHVGVAANGRGKLRVVLKREAEMPDVFSRVDCLGHASQCRSADQMLFGLALNFFEQFLDIFGIGLLLFTCPARMSEVVSYRAHKRRELFDTVFFG